MGWLLLGILSGLLATSWSQLEVVHSWKNVDYAFPTRQTRDALLRQGLFIPKNIAIIDVDVWEGNGIRKVFVTMPKFKAGTPATLATVGPGGLLQPYPEWSWFKEGSCDMTSVFRIQVDDCGRLWVLDTGTIDIFTDTPKQICRPQIILFDLYTDTQIGRYQFPSDVIDSNSLLVTIAVDTRGHKCQDTFAYIADVVSFKLIVFDANRQKSWRISSNYFYPYPLHGGFDISGVHFDLMDGILGLAVGPMIGNDRVLYWHSLASVRESWVKTSIIRNESLFTEGNGSPNSFMVSRWERPSQSAAEAMSSNGVLFFGLLGNNSIACWNSKLSYAPENMVVIAKNDQHLQFVSGVKISQGRLFVLSDRLQNYIVDEVPENEENYKILQGNLHKLTVGTKCESPDFFGSSSPRPTFSSTQRPHFGSTNRPSFRPTQRPIYRPIGQQPARLTSVPPLHPGYSMPTRPSFGNTIVFQD